MTQLLLHGADLDGWLLVVLAALVALGATKLLILFVRRGNIIAKAPGDNPCHTDGAKVHLGGVAVVLAAALVAIVSVGIWSPWRPVLFFAGGLTIIGLLDDLHPLTPGWKIILQTPLVFMVVLWLDPPSWMGYGMARVWVEVVWILVMTNAFNIMDVADGLLPGMSSVMLLAFGLLGASTGLGLGAILLAFGGATIGFLPWNASRGEVILGDSGSLPLGGLISIACLYMDWPSLGALSWVGAWLMMAVPMFEVAWVSVKRIRRGIPPWRGSPHHLVYAIRGRGVATSTAVAAMVGVVAVGGAIAMASIGATWEYVLLGAVMGAILAARLRARA